MLLDDLQERQNRAVDTVYSRLRQRQWPHPEGTNLDNCLYIVARFLVMAAGMSGRKRNSEISRNILEYAIEPTSDAECVFAMGMCAAMQSLPSSIFVNEQDLRGTGRTTRMILTAEAGSILVFSNLEHARRMESVVRELRAQHGLGMVTVLSQDQVGLTILSLGQPVIYDHSCLGGAAPIA